MIPEKEKEQNGFPGKYLAHDAEHLGFLIESGSPL
jgi:hypothetical protein